LTKQIQDSQNHKDRIRYVIQRHRLLNKVFSAIESLLPYVVTANDWVALVIDSRSDIALFDVRPFPINYSKTYDDFPGGMLMSAQVDRSVVEARKAMESVLATSWA
jgi:hypothetical protein